MAASVTSKQQQQDQHNYRIILSLSVFPVAIPLALQIRIADNIPLKTLHCQNQLIVKLLGHDWLDFSQQIKTIGFVMIKWK